VIGYNELVRPLGPVARQRISNLVFGGLLVVVGCALWLMWVSQTTTGEACRTGAGTSSFGLVVFAGLVILAPAGISVHAWRAGLPITWALPVVVAAGFIAVVAVFLTGEVWWSAHDCMT
jgi:hypothetical protein